MKTKKLLKMIAILLAGALIIVSIISVSKKGQPYASKFILANPVDLSSIAMISKFRSCVGHDYSGLNSQGQKESNRSMKHYFEPQRKPDLSTYRVAVYAPFNGKIASIKTEQEAVGKQVWLTSPSASNWKFIFFHIELLAQFKEGSAIRAGEPIGYFMANNQSNFDIALKKFDLGGSRQSFDSIFSHMNEAVLAEYQVKGISPETIIISKEYRDARPCDFSAREDPSEWVVLGPGGVNSPTLPP